MHGQQNVKNKMRDFNFSTNIIWNISHSTKYSARCYHKCTYLFT